MLYFPDTGTNTPHIIIFHAHDFLHVWDNDHAARRSPDLFPDLFSQCWHAHTSSRRRRTNPIHARDPRLVFRKKGTVFNVKQERVHSPLAYLLFGAI